MKSSVWKNVWPHALAVVIFMVVAIIYCKPAMEGMVVQQHDMVGVKGMAQQSIEFKEKHGHYPLWTNSMFSGMPAYQILIEGTNKISIGYLDWVFKFLPGPAYLFFIASICFYLLCCAYKMPYLIRLLGALAYAYASYNAILVQAGHITKLASMAYAPAVIAGIILVTQKKYWLGFATLLVFFNLFIMQNHIQVVYYFLIIIFCMGIAFLIKTLREKEYKHILVTGAIVVVTGLIGLLANSLTTLTTYEYSKETMRGGRSELVSTDNKGNKTAGGLDKDYAFGWSYGIGESFTAILPAYKGGSTGMSELGENNHTLEVLQNQQLHPQLANYIYGNLSSYWGDQPSTSGPVYFGVIICVLFIIGLFVVRSWHLWWIIPSTIIGFVLAWGSNLSSINYFLFDYLPFYNKFRAPSMALIIPQFTFVVLAVLALKEIFYGKLKKEELLKKLKMSGITVGVIAFVLVAAYFMGSFTSNNDKQLQEGITGIVAQSMSGGQQPGEQQIQAASTVGNSIMRALVQDRKSLYGGDLLRLFVFSALLGICIWLGINKKAKVEYILVALIVISFVDLITVDRRYLKSENYVSEEDFTKELNPNRADVRINQDTGYYRVFDRTVGNPYSSSRASYSHNSVGGYHPAKLALYQDLIEHQLSKGNMKVFDMLNTKYIIGQNEADGQPDAFINPNAAGPCWLAKNIKYVTNANEEMAALDSIALYDTVVIDKREQSKVAFSPEADSTASIQLVKNLNDIIYYKFKSNTNQFAVFSEIYYPLGWKAFIDGKESPVVKVNYALRGLAVPKGEHEIVFKFEPKSYTLSNTLGMIMGILSILLLILCIWRIPKECKCQKLTTVE